MLALSEDELKTKIIDNTRFQEVEISNLMNDNVVHMAKFKLTNGYYDQPEIVFEVQGLGAGYYRVDNTKLVDDINSLPGKTNHMFSLNKKYSSNLEHAT